MKVHIRTIVIVIAAAIFAFSGYKIISNLSERKEAENAYADIASQAVSVVTPAAESNTGSGATPSAETSSEVDINNPPISVNFEMLKKQNSNVAGWLYCAGTPINYPVVRCDDSADYSYYESHTFSGKKNSSGSIFTDYRNTDLFNDYNSILYGHSMKNGTMFAYMLRYTNQDFYNSHKYLWLLTETDIYRVDIIGAINVDDNAEEYVIPKNKAELDTLISAFVSGSPFRSDVNIASVEKTIMFSTCAYNGEERRIIVLGSLMKINKDIDKSF